jgi:hypothetical protein
VSVTNQLLLLCVCAEKETLEQKVKLLEQKYARLHVVQMLDRFGTPKVSGKQCTARRVRSKRQLHVKATC